MTGLDLFAGCGGASLGLARAGVHMVGHYERDSDACATLRAAFGPATVHECDLASLSGVDLPSVDLWWASPPCQPFSAAGKHEGQADDRDCYPHLLRLLWQAQTPTWLLIENVPALLWKRHRGYWAYIVRELRRSFAWVDFRVLDAADYGVPQHRRRVITVCGPSPIAWPTPTHGPGRLPHRTMGEALGLTGEQCAIGGGHNPNHPGDQRRHADLTDRPCTTVSATHGGAAGNAGPWVLTRPSPTVSASEVKGAGARAVAAAGGTPYRSDGGTLNRASCALKLGTGRRRLTIAECAILQDLEGHPIQGRTKTSRYRQVGNAVPPRLAEVVVRALTPSSPAT